MSDESKKPIYKQWWLYLVAVIVVAGVAFAATSGKEKKNTTEDKAVTSTETAKEDAKKDESAAGSEDVNKKDANKSEEKTQAASTDGYNIPADSKVTFDNFSAIKLGDSYDNVVALLGEGQQVASSDSTSDYKWSNNDKSAIAVTFDNNVVIGKIQTGLKKMECNVSLSAYNEISEESGTYDDMVAKFGTPQVMAENKLDGVEYVTYEYVTANGSRAEFTVSDGMIVAKDQSGLN